MHLRSLSFLQMKQTNYVITRMMEDYSQILIFQSRLRRQLWIIYLASLPESQEVIQISTHSMLIHTKHTIKNQSPVAAKVSAVTEYWNNNLLNQYSGDGKALRDKFRSRWNDNFATHSLTHESWAKIEPCLMKFIQQKYMVMEINSITEHNLDYDSHVNGLRVIAVGGIGFQED